MSYELENRIKEIGRIPLGLSQSAYWVYLTLAWRANAKTSLCFPSVDDIALHSGVSTASVRSALKELEGKSLITIQRRNGKSNVFIIHSPPQDVAPHEEGTPLKDVAPLQDVIPLKDVIPLENVAPLQDVTPHPCNILTPTPATSYTRTEKEQRNNRELSLSENAVGVSDSPETENEKRKRTQGQTDIFGNVAVEAEKPKGKKTVKKIPNCPYAEIVDIYHETLPELPRVRIRGEAIERNMRKLWVQLFEEPSCVTKEDGLENFRCYFLKFVRTSDQLMGRKKEDQNGWVWKSDLDWLLQPRHVVNIFNGRYANNYQDQF